MKEGWEYKKLVDECVILYGYPFDSKCFSSSNEDMPLIRIRDVKEGATSTYYKGDYLIGMDGEFNISPWQSDDALLNQRVCKISSNSSDVLMRYVYRFLVKELKKIEDETPFVTVKHLSAKKLNQITIPVPPLSEQQRIVSELDLLSSIIEKKKAQLKEYDQLAQSIFYDMFGDPVTNEKGWEVKKLGEVCETTSGGTPSKSHPEYYEGGIIPWLRSGEVSQGFIYNTEFCITEEGLRCSSAKMIPVDSVAIAMYGATVGQVGIIKSPMCTNQAICSILPNDIFIPIFLYHFLLSKKSDFLKVAVGGAQPNISQTVIKQTDIGIPPLSLQQSFASKIESIERQKALIQQSIKEVQTLFDSRMDYYFN